LRARLRARARALCDEYVAALKYFSQRGDQRTDEAANDISDATKTIVQKLLAFDGKKKRGLMVLIRVPTVMPDGQELYEKLSKCCAEQGLHNRLAVLMDASERRQNMPLGMALSKHHPKLLELKAAWEKTNVETLKKEIVQYEQLADLPCILILCEKGKMGDTFPASMRFYDLRARCAL
jgi:hypothetical protein